MSAGHNNTLTSDSSQGPKNSALGLDVSFADDVDWFFESESEFNRTLTTPEVALNKLIRTDIISLDEKDSADYDPPSCILDLQLAYGLQHTIFSDYPCPQENVFSKTKCSSQSIPQVTIPFHPRICCEYQISLPMF